MLERWTSGQVEVVPGFEELGLLAFTSTRELGSFGLHEGTATDVFGRWMQLADGLREVTARLAWAHQVHGFTIVEHRSGWSGWLRVPEGDGHLSAEVATAMAVTVADCVPVFVGHRSGAGAMLHSGWRGTAAHVTRKAIERLAEIGLPAHELSIHCGPAICGRCYVVGPSVFRELTGETVAEATPVDLRQLIAREARSCGVREVSVSTRCTRCDNARFFSHRAGDGGRQVGVLVSHASLR